MQPSGRKEPGLPANYPAHQKSCCKLSKHVQGQKQQKAIWWDWDMEEKRGIDGFRRIKRSEDSTWRSQPKSTQSSQYGIIWKTNPKTNPVQESSACQRCYPSSHWACPASEISDDPPQISLQLWHHLLFCHRFAHSLNVNTWKPLEARRKPMGKFFLPKPIQDTVIPLKKKA